MNETLNMTEEVTMDVVEAVEEAANELGMDTVELSAEPVVEVVKNSNHTGVIVGGLLFTAGVAGVTFVLDKTGKLDGMKKKYYDYKANKAMAKADKYMKKLHELYIPEEDFFDEEDEINE